MIATSLLWAMSLAQADDYTINDYGKDCAEEMGQLPAINCLSEQATILPVTVDGKEITEKEIEEILAGKRPPLKNCDKPAIAVSNSETCVPGSRILKIKSLHNGQKIETIILCRRYKTRRMNDPVFEDVGVIQKNVTTNKACWFAMINRKGKKVTDVPPPYSNDSATNAKALRFWKSPQENAEVSCVRCHTAQVFIRSPFLSQAKNDLTRDNALPNEMKSPPPFHVGKAFQKWNRKRPIRFSINEGAYYKKYGISEEVQQSLASPALCTQCHYLSGNCGELLRYATGEVSELPYLSSTAKQFPRSHWMPPPRGRFDSPAEREAGLKRWQQQNRLALEAVKSCCQDPEQEVEWNGEKTKICQDEATGVPPSETTKFSPGHDR